MKLLTLGMMVLLLAGFALGGDCYHDDCDGVTPCSDCTCDESATDECTCDDTVEGCTGDCNVCEADLCDEECTCECVYSEEVIPEEISHCGSGCH